MARGKRWSQQEIQLLREMLREGMNLDEIVKSGKLPDRTATALQIQISRLGSIDNQSKKFIVNQISLAEDILSLEEVLKRFSTAFEQICEGQELDKLALERYKIVFGAAKDYGPLLAHFERMSVVEREIENLKKMVEGLRAQVSARGSKD